MNQHDTFSAEPASYDQGNDFDGSYDPARPPERSSSKFLLGCLVGCGGSILLLIVGMVVAGFFVRSWLMNMIDPDPAAIRARTEKIADIDVPDTFQPEAGIKFELPFFGELGNFVCYEDKEHDGAILLVDVSDKITQGQPPEQWAKKTRVQVNDADIEDADSLENSQTETITRTIRGEEVTFKITTGTRKGTEEKRVVATGHFPGRLGQSFFLMATDADSVSVEEVKKVIESIE